MLKRILVGSFLLIFSTQLFAKNAVQQLLEEKSDKTAYEVLFDYFRAHPYTFPVDPSMLNQYNYTTQMKYTKFNHCVSAYPNSPNDLVESNLRVLSYTKFIPGTPSHGPLFPGIPDQYLEKTGCSLVNDLSSVSTSRAQMILDETFLGYESDGSMTCYSRSPDSVEYFQAGGMSVKSVDNLIIYKNSFVNNQGIYTEGYGYCWNE